MYESRHFTDEKINVSMLSGGYDKLCNGETVSCISDLKHIFAILCLLSADICLWHDCNISQDISRFIDQAPKYS